MIILHVHRGGSSIICKEGCRFSMGWCMRESYCPLPSAVRLSKVRGSWFLEATDFCHPQARQIHRCIFAPVTSVNAHYYSVLTTPFDMVNAHYVIIDFRAKFFIKIQNQASDTSRSLPSFSKAPFLLRAVPSERLGQVYSAVCNATIPTLPLFEMAEYMHVRRSVTFYIIFYKVYIGFL